MKIQPQRPSAPSSVSSASPSSPAPSSPTRGPAHHVSAYEPARDHSRVVPPGPPQLQASGPTVRSGSSALAEVGAHGGAGRTDPLERAARAVYARHGDRVHDLTDRAEVGRLISRTPQIDDLSATGTVARDATRCGGAAVFNGLLLDGNPAANSDALRAVAGERHLTLSGAQDEALRAMHDGHLTPHQAATLQDLTYRVADSGNPAVTGTTQGREVTQLVAALRSHDAFGGTSSLNLRLDDIGGQGHWTVTSTVAGHGTAHADSWPTDTGYADVYGTSGAEARDLTSFHRPDGTGRQEFIPGFTTDVTLTPGAGGRSELRLRDVDRPLGTPPTSVNQMSFDVAPGAPPRLSGTSSLALDGSTN